MQAHSLHTQSNKPWALAPLRSYHGWRHYAAAARRVHFVFYLIWCVLGTPFWFGACLGAVLSPLLFPGMLLGLGLDIVHKHPGFGWFIYATAVALFWGLFLAMALTAVRHQVRARIIDLEIFTLALLMVLAVALAAWYIHSELAGGGRAMTTGTAFIQ